MITAPDDDNTLHDDNCPDDDNTLHDDNCPDDDNTLHDDNCPDDDNTLQYSTHLVCGGDEGMTHFYVIS